MTLSFYARVVKLVDTQDLKSCGPKGCAGSSPAPGTKEKREEKVKTFFAFSAIRSNNLR